MALSRRAWLAIGALALSASAPSTAQTGVPETVTPEMVVTGYPDIVVNGRAIRCRAVAGDPLDDVRVGRTDTDAHTGMSVPQLMAIVPDDQDGYAWVRNHEQVTGPEFWQRVGVGMDRFVFRGSSDGKPMCVGAGVDAMGRFAGFRRIVDATAYRGQRLRFTAWVASRKARQVSFWLAAGTEWPTKPATDRGSDEPKPYQLLNGGNTNNVAFRGSNGWTPVLIETGPIHEDAHHVSYGFNLQGSGDVWVYEPRLEVVAAPAGGAQADDLIVIGREEG